MWLSHSSHITVMWSLSHPGGSSQWGDAAGESEHHHRPLYFCPQNTSLPQQEEKTYVSPLLTPSLIHCMSYVMTSQVRQDMTSCSSKNHVVNCCSKHTRTHMHTYIWYILPLTSFPGCLPLHFLDCMCDLWTGQRSGRRPGTTPYVIKPKAGLDRDVCGLGFSNDGNMPMRHWLQGTNSSATLPVYSYDSCSH